MRGTTLNTHLPRVPRRLASCACPRVCDGDLKQTTDPLAAMRDETHGRKDVRQQVSKIAAMGNWTHIPKGYVNTCEAHDRESGTGTSSVDRATQGLCRPFTAPNMRMHASYPPHAAAPASSSP